MRVFNRITSWAMMGALSAGWSASLCQAQVVSIDMDPVTPGIQNTLSASPGASITVAVVLQPGPAGVSSYGVSMQIDNLELSHTANVELLPAGFTANFTAGSGGFTANVVPGVDQVSTFEAFTFGAGPIAGDLQIGTITFNVTSAINDGLADLIPGFFAGGFDGMSDNASQSITPTFNPGYLVPEPGTTAAVFGVMALLTGAIFRRAGGRRA